MEIRGKGRRERTKINRKLQAHQLQEVGFLKDPHLTSVSLVYLEKILPDGEHGPLFSLLDHRPTHIDLTHLYDTRWDQGSFYGGKGKHVGWNSPWITKEIIAEMQEAVCVRLSCSASGLKSVCDISEKGMLIIHIQQLCRC